MSEDRRESRLRDGIAPLVGNYDFIFIDCPPSLDLLTLNGLCAADTVLIPLQCEFFALEGLSELMSTVRNTKSLWPYLDIRGPADHVRRPAQPDGAGGEKEVKKHFGNKLYATTIPRNVRLSEAPNCSMPVN